jgi:hypothetical protein
MTAPKGKHWTATKTKSVLRYMNSTLEYCILYSKDEDFQLTGYTYYRLRLSKFS